MKKIAFLLVLLFALNNTVLTVDAADALSGTAVSIVHDGETRIVSLENGYTAEVSFTVEPMAEEALRASATTRSKFTSTMKIKNSLYTDSWIYTNNRLLLRTGSLPKHNPNHKWF